MGRPGIGRGRAQVSAPLLRFTVPAPHRACVHDDYGRNCPRNSLKTPLPHILPHITADLSPFVPPSASLVSYWSCLVSPLLPPPVLFLLFGSPRTEVTLTVLA